jgi:hypothetical protein
MNWISSVVIGSVIASSGLMAQSPATPQPTSTGQTESASTSDQELNTEAYIKLLRSDVRKSKSQIVGQVMQFDASQAAVFWPIYKQFEADLTKIGDQTAVLVKKYVDNYSDMTNDIADQLANQLLSIEQQRNELKRRYYQKLKTALDPITAARFLQVENQLERVVDLQIASQLPVIQAGGGDTQ